MRFGKVVPLLCGDLWVLAAGSDAYAVTNLNTSRSNIARSGSAAKGAPATRKAAPGPRKAGQRSTTVKSGKSNTSD